MSLASPAQIRAARAMLDWTMVQLAEKAGVSISSVKRFEDGQGAPATIGLMQDALEAAGVRFLADDGTGSGLRCRGSRVVSDADADGQSLAFSRFL